MNFNKNLTSRLTLYECPACAGTGQDPYKDRVCVSCEGIGEVSEDRYDEILIEMDNEQNRNDDFEYDLQKQQETDELKDAIKAQLKGRENDY